MRLVDVDEAIRRIEKKVYEVYGYPKTEYSEGYVNACKAAVKMLKSLSTVDAVEVVRCKDCKWYGYYSCEMGGNNWMRDGNGFCDRGERKDGDI